MNQKPQSNICVIGSIHADLSLRVPHLSAPGETVSGTDFQLSPGGKGANQAAAAAKLGGTVCLLGRIGSDSFGESVFSRLQSAGINCSGLERDGDLPTGIAMIQVDAAGQNAICVAPGANAAVTTDYLHRVKRLIDDASIVLLQLEIPMETTLWAAEYCAGQGKLVILDPAPALPLSDELLAHVGIVTPNDTELSRLTGIPLTDGAARLAACKALLTLGVKTVINTAGEKGVYIYSGDELAHYPAYDVAAVDTTAAGDSFNGALAYAFSVGLPFSQAVEFANLAAALSTTGYGAQAAMPTAQQMAAASCLPKKNL